jgi:hypothetical protein
MKMKKSLAATGCPHVNGNILEIERKSTRSHSVKNCLWKKLWTCRKTDYRMNIFSSTHLITDFVIIENNRFIDYRISSLYEM